MGLDRHEPYPIATPVCELPMVTGKTAPSERYIASRQSGFGAENWTAVVPGVDMWTT